MRKKFTQVYGFTLIEVMVSVLLLGLIGMLLMGGINSAIVARDSVEEISGHYQMVRQALSRMSREIAMAYLSKNINLADPAYVTQFKGRKNSLYFSAFGNVVFQKDAAQSDQQVLGYFLETDKSGKQSLMRSHRANLNLDVEKGGWAEVLCPSVSALEFSYFDARYKKWEDLWIADPLVAAVGGQEQKETKDKKDEQQQERPDAPKPWRLPTYVKISLTAEMKEGVSITWVTETEIVVQEPLDLN